LLSNISTRFVNLNPDQIDPEIQGALQQITEFFGFSANQALNKATSTKGYRYAPK
jgi:hypothetical protein